MSKVLMITQIPRLNVKRDLSIILTKSDGSTKMSVLF